MKKLALLTLIAALVVPAMAAISVTGDPVADGWFYHGHSLANGIYADGSANYGFDIYSNAITVSVGSNLVIDDGSYSWQVGDTVIGAGGRFKVITAQEAGWGAISGNAVNSLLSAEEYGPKLQVKLGTESATWTTSSNAPGSGNGSTSTGNGGNGTVHFRTSGWFHADTPLSSQVTDTTWSANSGMLMTLDKDDHIRRRDTSVSGSYVFPDTEVARVIWIFDDVSQKPISWQLLLNTSLLDRLYPNANGLTPKAGDLAVFSIQDRDSAYTDAVVAIVPEPATLALLGLGGLLLRKRKK